MQNTKSRHFVLIINLGDDAMQSAEDIARALQDAARRIRVSSAYNGSIRDINGNQVGSFDILTK